MRNFDYELIMKHMNTRTHTYIHISFIISSKNIHTYSSTYNILLKISEKFFRSAIYFRKGSVLKKAQSKEFIEEKKKTIAR